VKSSEIEFGSAQTVVQTSKGILIIFAQRHIWVDCQEFWKYVVANSDDFCLIKVPADDVVQIHCLKSPVMLEEASGAFTAALPGHAVLTADQPNVSLTITRGLIIQLIW
jgi:hypothetical protein